MHKRNDNFVEGALEPLSTTPLELKTRWRQAIAEMNQAIGLPEVPSNLFDEVTESIPQPAPVTLTGNGLRHSRPAAVT